VAVLKARDVEEKLREFHGNMAAVGRALGVTRVAVFNFVQRRPTLKAICQECRESMKDHAESSLYRAVLDGEAWAVQFYLKTQAKDRGYSERQEHTGAGGQVIQGRVEHRGIEGLEPYREVIETFAFECAEDMCRARGLDVAALRSLEALNEALANGQARANGDGQDGAGPAPQPPAPPPEPPAAPRWSPTW
jgi:hypothetical protein